MSQTLVISDELFSRLSKAARNRGFATVEELLVEWQSETRGNHDRSVAVQTITELRTRLVATYGEMADSTELIRDDRER